MVEKGTLSGHLRNLKTDLDNVLPDLVAKGYNLSDDDIAKVRGMLGFLRAAIPNIQSALS